MRALALLVAAGLLAACGGPATFRDDVTAFADGVTAATAAFREEQQHVVEYREDQELATMLRNRPELLPGPTGAACRRAVSDWARSADSEAGTSAASYRAGVETVLERCRLHQRGDGDGAASPVMLQLTALNPQHTRLARALEVYADALVTLATSAGDRAAFNEAAVHAGDRVVAFVAAANALTGTALDIEPEFRTVESALTEALGAYLEGQRRRALARVVTETQPVVETAADRLATISRHYRIAVVPGLRQDYEDAVRAVLVAREADDPAAYERNLARVVDRQKAFAAYASFDPGLVYDQMVTAHRALGKRLHDPGVLLGALAESIQDFARLSRDALTAVRTARGTNAGAADQ